MHFKKKKFSFRKIDIAIFARYIRKILLQDDTCDTPAHSFYLFSRLNPILILESQCDAHGFETRQNSWQYFLISFNDDTRGARVAPHLSFNLRSTLLRFESSMFEPRIFDTCLPFRYPDVLLLSRLVSRDPASKRLFLLSFFLHYFNRFFLILVFPFKG